jgi:hypothetical protein
MRKNRPPSMMAGEISDDHPPPLPNKSRAGRQVAAAKGAPCRLELMIFLGSLMQVIWMLIPGTYASVAASSSSGLTGWRLLTRQLDGLYTPENSELDPAVKCCLFYGDTNDCEEIFPVDARWKNKEERIELCDTLQGTKSTSISTWNVAKITSMESCKYHRERTAHCFCFIVTAFLSHLFIFYILHVPHAVFHNWGDRPDFDSIENWDVSSVTTMASMFFNSRKFNQPLQSWDVGTVIDMSSMFVNAKEFNKPIGEWNVGRVTNMANMFWRANNFNAALRSWDVSNVRDMKQMFKQAAHFDQPLGSWDVTNVGSDCMKESKFEPRSLYFFSVLFMCPRAGM